MTDLQVSLLVIGVIVVAAVMGYNWFQQWRLKRRLEEAFEGERPDVLLRERTGETRKGERLEPQLHAPAQEQSEADIAEPAAAPPEDGLQSEAIRAAAAALPPVAGFDPDIDYVVAIDSAEPITAAGLAELHTRAAACGRRFRVAGFNEQAHAWQEAGRLSGARYAHLRIALQLVSRKGPADSAALAALCAAATDCVERYGGLAACPDVETALARSRELDQFCAEVDVAIGVNVIAPADAKFTGPRIRAAAENLGLELEPDGVFHYLDDAHRTLFTLDNHEPAPFLPEQVKQITTGGVTLVLDVPRVPDGAAALDTMVGIARELAAGLGGTLVDDNRVPLSEHSIHAIRQQLASIHDTMEARGMPPGSERALRLFS